MGIMRARAAAVVALFLIASFGIALAVPPARAAKGSGAGKAPKATTSTTAAAPTPVATTVVEPTPAPEAVVEAAVVEATPVVEPVVEPAPVVDPAPVAETAPVAEPAPLVEHAPSTPKGPCAEPAKRVVPVTHTVELKAALAAALPGDRIELADNVYAGQFVIDRSGTASERIRLCGSRNAILQHGNVTTGRGIHLNKVSFWDLNGFTVQTVKKGIVMDSSTFNVLNDLEVHNIGEEAIRMKVFSTDNQVTNSDVHHTGLFTYNYGEGVYIGTAVSEWDTWTNDLPDASDRNQVRNSRFSNTAAEAIDVKEGTQFGLLEGNTFDGTGLRVRSWVDVKGNNWMIRNNTGTLAKQDGFLTEIATPGWGTRNTFVGNVANLQGATGYGFNMRPGNILACDNVTTGSPLAGIGNIACTAVSAL